MWNIIDCWGQQWRMGCSTDESLVHLMKFADVFTTENVIKRIGCGIASDVVFCEFVAPSRSVPNILSSNSSKAVMRRWHSAFSFWRLDPSANGRTSSADDPWRPQAVKLPPQNVIFQPEHFDSHFPYILVAHNERKARVNFAVISESETTSHHLHRFRSKNRHNPCWQLGKPI
jgi:hypothetical protein